MDLDELKNIWNKTSQPSGVDSTVLLELLNKKGVTALDRLLLVEKISMYLSLLLIAIPFLHNFLFPVARYPLFSMIWFVSFCVILFAWEIIKIKLLKKIDVKRINIISAAKYITRYKRYLQYELFAGLIWFLVFIFSFVYPLTFIVSKDVYNYFLLFVLLSVVVCIAIIFLFYRFFYKKNIKEIEDSIEEIVGNEHEI